MSLLIDKTEQDLSLLALHAVRIDKPGKLSVSTDIKSVFPVLPVFNRFLKRALDLGFVRFPLHFTQGVTLRKFGHAKVEAVSRYRLGGLIDHNKDLRIPLRRWILNFVNKRPLPDQRSGLRPLQLSKNHPYHNKRN